MITKTKETEVIAKMMELVKQIKNAREGEESIQILNNRFTGMSETMEILTGNEYHWGNNEEDGYYVVVITEGKEEKYPVIDKFEVGKKYVYPSLYGESVFWTCISRTVTSVTFLEEDGVGIKTKDIKLFGEFGNVEHAEAWEYKEHYGYLTAER